MSDYMTTHRLAARRTYVVTLKADDGPLVHCYAHAAYAERAKQVACAAELAPPNAVLAVRVSEFEEVAR